jgi:hypothetical protein
MNATLGLRAKTGRAIAVVLTGSRTAPLFVWRGEVSLIDPAVPATGQPYHEVMEMAWSESVVAVRPLVLAIEAVAGAVLRELIADMRARGMDVRAMGVVGSAPRNLEKIGNYHIRAHAAEGVLFRQVLETAAKLNGLPCSGYSEQELNEAASGLPVAAVMKNLGRSAGAPWRADERLAATAAWLALMIGHRS